MILKQTQRYTHVTDEHLPIAPEHQGRELAAPWRRAAAVMTDLFLCVLFVLPIWILGVCLTALHLQAPSILPYMMTMFDYDTPEEKKEELAAAAIPELGMLISRRRPDLLPPEIHEAIRQGDDEKLMDFISTSSFRFDLGERGASTFDLSENRYEFRNDILFGRFAAAFGSLSGFLLYFTLMTWWLRGRTPGKWLAGIRTVRLDGKRLSLWDAFGRAGGYSASLSTFGLGFLEVLWHPNRQTIHDRISGTVVVRWPRLTPKAKTPELAESPKETLPKQQDPEPEKESPGKESPEQRENAEEEKRQ